MQTYSLFSHPPQKQCVSRVCTGLFLKHNLYKAYVARQGEGGSVESHCESNVAYNVRVCGKNAYSAGWSDKMSEGNTTVAYSDTVVNKNKLTKR